MSTSTNKAWNFIDRLKGDKVVWIIVLMLIMFSLLCMFSSTSRMLKGGATRVDIFMEQIVTVAAGLVLIIVFYNIRSIKVFKFFAVFGYILSIIMLLLLAFKINTPFIKAPNINGAHRILEVGGFQIHALEAAKISAVMYLAYAIDGLKRGTLLLSKKMTKGLQKIVYIYFPFVLTFVLTLLASNSAALLIGATMYIVILIGGTNTKEMILLGVGVILLALLCFGIFKMSDGKAFTRIGTAVGRILDKSEDKEAKFLEARPYSPEYYEALDEIRQPFSARIAIHEGGILGKLPGQSTQKYKVSLISEDYIFSFIAEEYGLFGAILVLVLYLSLMSRASIIIRGLHCTFSQLCVGGLCFLISAQAFLHIFVNLDIGIMTGQTLPMVSHGRFAFLCFSIAFGIILSISRMAKSNTDKELRNAEPLINFSDDDIKTNTFVEDEI